MWHVTSVTYWHHTSVLGWDAEPAVGVAMLLLSFGGHLDIGDSRAVCLFSTEADTGVEADVVVTKEMLVA